ncbi:hypothetical protein B0H13DRAFT_2385116 [Mycena leptocephala]|nr:hypothetical protein B0H13DRAFT_2385116 [Mycena leptocephala]
MNRKQNTVKSGNIAQLSCLAKNCSLVVPRCQIVVDGIPTSFNPSSPSAVQELYAHNRTTITDPSIIAEVRWLNTKVVRNPEKKASSLLVTLTNVPSANHSIVQGLAIESTICCNQHMTYLNDVQESQPGKLRPLFGFWGIKVVTNWKVATSVLVLGIKTLENGWDAVMKALTAQGLSTGTASPVPQPPTEPSSSAPSIPQQPADSPAPIARMANVESVGGTPSSKRKLREVFSGWET